MRSGAGAARPRNSPVTPALDPKAALGYRRPAWTALRRLHHHPWPRFPHGPGARNRFRENIWLAAELHKRRFWQQFVGDGRLEDPLVSPVHANLTDLPPTLIVLAGFDPLREEGRRFRGQLESSGVRTRLVEYPQTFHGFLGFEALAESRDAMDGLAGWIDDWRRGWPPADPS
jgi:acetyl esterase/lipase